MSAATTPTYEGKALPWRKLERNVFKLQRRIYRASSRGDRQAVHRLRLGLGQRPPFEPPLMHPKTRGDVIIYGIPTLPVEVSGRDLRG